LLEGRSLALTLPHSTIGVTTTALDMLGRCSHCCCRFSDSTARAVATAVAVDVACRLPCEGLWSVTRDAARWTYHVQHL